MKLMDSIEAQDRVFSPRPGMKFPHGKQDDHIPVRVRCAFCKWGGRATNVGGMREAHRRHMELKHPELLT